MTEVMEKRRTTNAGAGLRRRSRTSQPKRSNQSRVRLEQVLGLTASCSSLSASSGLVAYPAGCVVVLLDLKSTKQRHIMNSCRKPFSALSFSHDGKLVVTGESGHLPCVRVWDLEGSQKAEVQTHKYGVSCVAFSHSDQYIVSVGFQHDMNICVWDWKKGALIASNKVSSNVSSVSFSEDSSYFVTAGNRHLKFWYLHQSANNRVNSTVPLIGRSALLGEHKNSVIVAVACGRGVIAARTFCLTSSALLCVFNSQRTMEAWVHLKVSSASSLSVCGDQVFCGCANGIVRVFSSNLSYICTLQHPHRLGVELQSSQSPGRVGAVFPDTVALGLDSAAHMLTVVYSDHSLYCWDLTVLKEPRRTYSALYHSGCIWSLEVYPDLEDFDSCLPPYSFITSSSDNTIRMWCTESPHNNRYSQDLQRIVYVGETVDSERTELESQGKSGLRVLTVSPDGAHLATGDRHGNLSVFGLEFMEELHKIEAHNSEILCLSFSPKSSGMRLLASASRDRLIHIFNRDQDYNLIQSLYDHSGSITAVRFTGDNPDLKIVSCGADKSIYVQTAEEGTGLFLRTHHVVEKSSIYDLDLDSTWTQAAFACQDRNIRVYSVENGKVMKTLKGSTSDEGALLKVTFDPSGLFVASSCSDKTICIFDYESGECVATLCGHSEIVTSIRFSTDCTHLITASGDGCIFVWRLDSSMTSLMRKRRGLDRKLEKNRIPNIRRETFITSPSTQMSLLVEESESEVMTPGRAETTDELPLLQTNGKMPLWFRKLQGGGGAPITLDQSEAEPPQVRRRWVEQMNPIKVFSQSPDQNLDLDEELDQDLEQDFNPQSLESLLMDKEEGEESAGMASCSFGLFPDHSTSSRRETFITGPSNQMSLPVEEAESEVMTPGRTETKDELPLLQTNGKMPLWFRKLQRGEGAPATLDQSEAEPPQVKRLWAEQMNPIKVSFQSPTQNQDVLVDEDLGQDLEQDFCPQSLENLLVDKEEGEEPAGVALCSFGLFPDHGASDRDFAVQGCPSEEVKGEMDQDFVSSDGSTESSEQNHDADCESTSESRSSLVLENHQDPLEENHLEQSPLQKHFDSLALNTNNDDFLSLSEERFDTDLRSLQPPKQKHFLQPRLSLSTRFLSRFQDRIRSKAPTAVPRILEESSIDNIQVQPQTEPSLKKESGLEPVSSDFGLKTTSAESSVKFGVKDGSRRNTDSLSIVGNVVSVKKEFNQRMGFYEKENVNPDHGLKNLVCESPGSVLCGGAEELLGDMSVSAPLVTTPPKSIVPFPPAAVAPPPDLAPSLADTEQGVADDITSCPASDCDRPHPPPGEQEVQQMAWRLLHTVEEAVQLYRQVQGIPALAAVLRDAFEDLHSTVNSMCGDGATDRSPGNCSSRKQSSTNRETEDHSKDATHYGLTGHNTDLDKCNPCGHLEPCNHTVALLERYSDLLVQMTRDKLN